MSKNQSTLPINFDKLYNIPYIKQFEEELFKQEVTEYYQLWSSEEMTPYHDQLALIRAIECTNGCVQYALRDRDPNALTVEQARACMKLSMGFIQSKELTFPDGNHIKIDKVLAPELDKVRDLYYYGFKRGDNTKLRQFYAHSVALFNAIGYDHILNAIQVVKYYYEDVFTAAFLLYGLNYMKQFLEVIPLSNEEEFHEFAKATKDDQDFYPNM